VRRIEGGISGDLSEPGLREIPNGIPRQWPFPLVTGPTGLSFEGSSRPSHPSQTGW
jgi:hypothetical protein